jgi:hypothetical protein
MDLQGTRKALEDSSDRRPRPTGIPLVYGLEGDLTPTRRFYLADAAELERAQSAVARQGRATG